MKKIWIIFAAAILLCSVTGKADAQIVVMDGDFAQNTAFSTYEITGVGGLFMPIYYPTGGNPDARIRITNLVYTSASNSEWGFYYPWATQYDPSILGAIGSLNYMEDYLSHGSAPHDYAGVGIRQNGKNYYYDYGQSYADVWTTISLQGLQAGDFRTRVDPNDHPDWSATGAEMYFGFFVADYGNGVDWNFAESSIDNLKFEIFGPSNSTVPEPATVALLGTGLLGAFLRRRRS